MKEKAFLKYLLNNNVGQDQATIFLSRLSEFNNFLKNNNNDIDLIPKGGILNYTEYLVEKKSDAVLDLLRALINYANYTKKYDYIVEIIDIVEAYNAMDNLYQRIAEKFNEKIRDEIFRDIDIPPLGVDPDKKPEITKIIMKRLEETLGEEKTIGLLAP
ncbi:MAG: hypothetical protein ACFFCL_09420, partial [Promethearchaeota archaeon]